MDAPLRGGDGDGGMLRRLGSNHDKVRVGTIKQHRKIFKPMAVRQPHFIAGPFQIGRENIGDPHQRYLWHGGDCLDMVPPHATAADHRGAVGALVVTVRVVVCLYHLEFLYLT